MSLFFFSELSRRRVWRVALLYVVGAWVVLQVADLAFPGLNVPESSIRYVWIAAIVCFPLALLLGWRFDFRQGRLVTTAASAGESHGTLSGADRLLLALILLVALAVCGAATGRIVASASIKPVTTENVVSSAQSIAILPFENMSGDAANDAFTSGMHDDLLTNVAQIQNFKVISRRSVSSLDSSLGMRDIGRVLGVASVLVGGVQRVGDRLRINVRLINAATDQHIWADSFDRQLTTDNIFDIQSEIVTAIASNLSITLSTADKSNLERRPTESLDAYEAYLLGRQFLISRRSDDLMRAAEEFDTAIRLDPDYTLAHVGLAEAYLLMENYGHIDRREAISVASRALETALSQNALLPAANAVHGLLNLRRFDEAQARVSFERAIAQDPNWVPALHWLGDMLVYLSEPSEAIPFLERANELDPLAPVVLTTLGEAYVGVGRFGEAEALFHKIIDLFPDYPGAYFRMGEQAYQGRGDLVGAVRWLRQELAVDPGRTTTLLGAVYLDLGDDNEAERWIERGLTLHPEGFFPLVTKLALHRYRGERDEALSLARRLHQYNPGNNASLYTLVLYEQYEEAVREFAHLLPELDCNNDINVHRNQRFRAMNLSLAFEKTGNSECAERILDALQAVVSKMPRRGFQGYGFLDVEILARQGEIVQALAALRAAVDGGLRAFFWAQIIESPHTAALDGNAEFEEIVDAVSEDAQRELDRLRELERRGQLAQVPDRNQH